MALVVVLWQWAGSQRAAERPSPTPADQSQETRPIRGLLIDINVADVRELKLLPRIGPVLAQRIVHDRIQRGKFQSVAELDRVHGIGEKTVERVAGICTVSLSDRTQTMVAAKNPRR